MSITAGITVDYATHVGHSFLVQVLIFLIFYLRQVTNSGG